MQFSVRAVVRMMPGFNLPVGKTLENRLLPHVPRCTVEVWAASRRTAKPTENAGDSLSSTPPATSSAGQMPTSSIQSFKHKRLGALENLRTEPLSS